MKKGFCWRWLLLVWIGWYGGNLTLQAAPRQNIQAGCVSSFDPTTDYFPEKIQVHHSQGLEVQYRGHYKLVRVKHPWLNAQVSFSYLLVQCGTPPPPKEDFPEAQIIEVPVRSLAVLSTVYLPAIEKLKLHSALLGLSDTDLVNTPSILQLLQSHQVQEVSRNNTVNEEKLLALNPQLILTYGTGDALRDGYAKWLQWGLKVAIVADYTEETPLGRAEWLKFIALFFNREALAQADFEKTALQYEQLRHLTREVKIRPTVFTGLNYQGTWYMPGGKSYVARLLRDAGARYLWEEDRSIDSLRLSFESVLAKASEANFWLNMGRWESRGQGLAEDPRYLNFRAFEQQQMYNNNAQVNTNGGNDYWETGIANPHLILADLIRIFHPELLPKHSLRWYRRLD